MRKTDRTTDKLIYNVLSLSWNPGILERTKDIMSEFSCWNLLFIKCLKEKICGSFYYNCEENSLGSFFPDKYLKKFKNEYLSILGHNTLQLEKVNNIFLSFEKNLLPVLVIKGYSLLKKVYPSLGARYPADIDLVVPKNSLSAAKRLLNSEGYKSLPLYPNILRKNPFMPIDIKTDILGADRIRSRSFIYSIRFPDIFERAVPWGPENNYVKIPSREDHILILCYHAEKHSYMKLSFFYDLANVMYTEQSCINISAFLSRVFQSGLEKPVYICLNYIREVLSFPVDKQIMKELEKTINFSKIDRVIINRILRGKKPRITGPLLPVLSIKTTKKRLIFIIELLFPKKEILRQCTGIVNPKFSWLMYPARILQLTGSFLKSLIKSTY